MHEQKVGKLSAQIGIHTCTRSRQTTLAATHRAPRQGTDFWKEHVSVIQLQQSIIIAIFLIYGNADTNLSGSFITRHDCNHILDATAHGCY